MPELALALGGGGVKGIAHIGVVRVLEREGITISAISGTSAGGLLGAFFAAGYPIQEVENIAGALRRPGFFSRNPNDPPSLLGLQGGFKILVEHFGDMKFEDLKIPFACTAVDLATSQEIVLAHGSVVEAILATIAIPGIFPPRPIENYLLVDGGVLDPVPVAIARWLAPTLPVVAVCLHPAPAQWAHLPDFKIPSAATPFPRPIRDQFARLRLGQSFQIFVNSIDVTSRMLAELRMEKEHPEVIIRPDVVKYGILEDADPQEIIRAGEEATEQALPAIRQALSWSSQLTRYFRHPELPGKVLNPESDL